MILLASKLYEILYSLPQEQLIVLNHTEVGNRKHLYFKLHGYTVHQQCWTLLLPTDAHNFKKTQSY